MTDQPSQAFKKLREKLHEIFQLDRADLDFGIYRIMNMKRDQIVAFLDDGLLPQVKAALAEYQSGDKDGLRKELADLEKSIRDAGMNPDDSPKVKDLRTKIAASTDASELENEVYSHLYNFFRRYYHEGDFISQRRYKEGVYAIPYEGEEVKLHWANHDQYYIKTSEYLRDYTFRLGDGKRVHFKLVEATTEKDNVKAQKGKERRFALVADEPVVVENGEAVIRFTYLPNPEKQTDLNDQAVQALKTNGVITKDFHGLFAIAETPSNPNRTVLEKHLAEYTARNTFDYFIHKNLGKFLRTELDFFIKNEVLHLDDVAADGVGVEELQKRLAKIKALRKIALKLIDFLAQLEDFQKKLWLKKKFVVETSYLVTLDLIPEDLYPEIAANEEQREEWVRLFAIDEIQGGEGDLVGGAIPGYSEPLAVEFLKANKGLPISTRHFEDSFGERVLNSLSNWENHIGGLLLNCENSEALRLLSARFRKGIQAVLIDPPYNTGEDGFLYKDGYQHSTWAAGMSERLSVARALIASTGVAFVHIDDNEYPLLWDVLRDSFGDTYLGSYVWKRRSSSGLSSTPISLDHEYVLAFASDPTCTTLRGLVKDQSAYPYFDEKKGLHYASTDLTIGATREQRPNQFYPIANPRTGVEYPPNPKRVWRFFPETMRQVIKDDLIIWPDEADGQLERPRFKTYFDPDELKTKPCSSWIESANQNDREIAEEESEYELEILQSSMNQEGGRTLSAILGDKRFPYPKPLSLERSLARTSLAKTDWLLDFYAGSGTSLHAVMSLNREDSGTRGFIGVEMGEHFENVLIPRIQRVSYTDNWREGKAQDVTPLSLLCKVIRLESYEDALANLSITPPTGAADLLDPAPDSLGEDYLLRYMMEEETKGSASLLNVHRFADPTAYKLKVKAPGTDETREVAVDLLETFNWLIGLRVDHIAAPQTFAADFERDQNERLTIKGDRLRKDDGGAFWFRTVTGWVPENLRQPHDSRHLKVLIIWRKLTGDPEADNLVLDHYLRRQRYTAKDLEFDLIYVNGDNNLENLKRDDETWKVRLIEEDFQRLMFDVEDV